ncbi:MAG: hypothetical protein V2J89_16950 [Halieaceae bacterium]|jgi:hypothetical protein|nr:hypothetical protein [Halieaceae bacterium]
MHARKQTFIALVISLAWLAPQQAMSLTVSELFRACEAAQQPCAALPWVQAYLGGGFDLIASLQEQTDHLHPVYCKAPRELFQVDALLAYLESQQRDHGDMNAMLVFVRYLEERGGC